MSKLKITHVLDEKSVEYTLEFTKRTEQMMEERGFRPNELADKPMTMWPKLFAGAFLANHRWVKQDVIEKIYAELPERSKLMERLMEMYTEQISAMVDDLENTSGNVTWEMVD